MKCEMEYPIWDLLLQILCHLVLRPGELGESVGGYDMFMAGWFVIPQIKPPLIPVWMEYALEYTKSVGKWEAIKVGPWLKSHPITTADISKNTGHRVHDREV